MIDCTISLSDIFSGKKIFSLNFFLIAARRVVQKMFFLVPNLFHRTLIIITLLFCFFFVRLSRSETRLSEFEIKKFGNFVLVLINACSAQTRPEISFYLISVAKFLTFLRGYIRGIDLIYLMIRNDNKKRCRFCCALQLT